MLVPIFVLILLLVRYNVQKKYLLRMNWEKWLIQICLEQRCLNLPPDAQSLMRDSCASCESVQGNSRQRPASNLLHAMQAKLFNAFITSAIIQPWKNQIDDAHGDGADMYGHCAEPFQHLHHGLCNHPTVEKRKEIEDVRVGGVRGSYPVRRDLSNTSTISDAAAQSWRKKEMMPIRMRQR